MSVKNKPVCLYSDLQVQTCAKIWVHTVLQVYIHLSIYKPIFKCVHGSLKDLNCPALCVILIAPLPWKIHKCMEVGVVCNVIGVGSEVTDQRMEESGRTQGLSTVKNKKGKGRNNQQKDEAIFIYSNNNCSRYWREYVLVHVLFGCDSYFQLLSSSTLPSSAARLQQEYTYSSLAAWAYEPALRALERRRQPFPRHLCISLGTFTDLPQQKLQKPCAKRRAVESSSLSWNQWQTFNNVCRHLEIGLQFHRCISQFCFHL